MKRFSLISESIKSNFVTTAVIKLNIQAENSGEAGYISDSILGSIDKLDSYSIESIEEPHLGDDLEPQESDLNFFVSKSIERLKAMEVEAGKSCPGMVVSISQVIYMLNNAKNKLNNGI